MPFPSVTDPNHFYCHFRNLKKFTFPIPLLLTYEFVRFYFFGQGVDVLQIGTVDLSVQNFSCSNDQESTVIGLGGHRHRMSHLSDTGRSDLLLYIGLQSVVGLGRVKVLL